MTPRQGFARLFLGALSMGKEALRMVLRRPVVGVLAVPLDPAGRVVMMRRRDTGTWCFPGGMVDWGERLEEALAREIVEETGLSLVAVERVVGLYSDPQRDPRLHSVAILVEARVGPRDDAARAAEAKVNPLEVLEVRAFDRDALPDEMAWDTAQMASDWRRGAPAILR